MAARKKGRTRPKKKSAKARAPRRARKAAPKKKAAAHKRAPAKKAPARRAAARPAAPARIPSGVGFISQHMDYTSHDMDGVKRFYTEVLGFSDYKHMTEGFNYLAVKTGPSSSFGFMPPMPGPPEQWQPPREPTIYLFVADVDRAYRDLSSKGASFEQPPQNMPWGHRVARLRDPEGRLVCLAQVMTKG